LGRISHVLRQLLRAQGGEPPEPEPSPESDLALAPAEDREPWTTLAAREPWTAPAVTGADHAMEREIELARLEKENEELRRLLGIAPPTTRSNPQGGEEMSEHATYGSGLHAGRVQPTQPRPFEPPLTLGGFNVPRRQPVGINQPPVASLAMNQKRRPLGPP